MENETNLDDVNLEAAVREAFEIGDIERVSELIAPFFGEYIEELNISQFRSIQRFREKWGSGFLAMQAIAGFLRSWRLEPSLDRAKNQVRVELDFMSQLCFRCRNDICLTNQRLFR